jgi:Reverse transcriptase (RNA-dependent DNA polymerase)
MSHVWRPAIYEELMSFINRKDFKKRDKKLVIEQLRRKLMTTKWIFKENINPDGTIKYKARCVARGFMQIPGVDYTESFAPVESDSGIRIVIGIFLFFLHMFPQDEWVLETFDVEPSVYRVTQRTQGTQTLKPGGNQQYLCRAHQSNVWKH